MKTETSIVKALTIFSFCLIADNEVADYGGGICCYAGLPTITNCTMADGHGGVVIGSEMSGGVRRVVISNCVFTGTDRGIRTAACNPSRRRDAVLHRFGRCR